eukprot:CAMPEP_0119118916 /NCGR_PEP_ID=MMETSP1310-20130426/634_1 /TAXON_ID=464262 /ORGANISM="Genus nov. species nov., Strain RCC2339" /LENGTH=249 /DNA_ID=CAMNT_0007108317 /DNA_START=60 /DNA_END=809 /DNA_ORIENTATION=+
MASDLHAADANYVAKFAEGRRDIEPGVLLNDWKLLLTGDEIQSLVKTLAEAINERFRDSKKSLVLTCILKGAVFFTVDLARYLTIPYSMYFLEASSYHNAQTQSDAVELLSKIVPSKFEGRHVLLLDELWDNGRTLNCVKEELMRTVNIGNDDITTCTLFAKLKSPNNYPLPELYAIALPNVWVVGYGLDDAQEKRGWRALFGKPKVDGVPKHADDVMFDSTEGGVAHYKKVRSRLHEESAESPVVKKA